MTPFILAALALLAVTAFFLLLPLLRPSAENTDESALEATRAILRDQLAELEKEAREGKFSAPDFDEAREELKRRVLEETALAHGDSGATKPRSRPNRVLAVTVIALLTLSSAIGYAFLGNLAALDPLQRQTPDGGSMTQEQIDAAIAKMAADLEANPDNEQGWVRLGNAYKVLQRPAEAANAYARAENLIAADPTLLSDYAEALAATGNGLKGKPVQLIERALQLDPEHARALFLAGAAAYETGNKAAAADYWEKLLPKVEPGSEVHTLLKEKIDAFRAAGGAQNNKGGKP
jgi:cytochrome c-type biogenesis protein CcmH